ncbi:hypothetical protein [Flexibacterium corallicola]|uniref:hypothetical protein n=1 Tax=Flexibacterium corallicola TaxID=3037259 RepID=UPI00286F2886|nr:hypothetical protein [Pseudovibrio sp. M1P-2-3]
MTTDRLITLEFINEDACENSIIQCSRASIPSIMEWYGCFYAGDDYHVFANGRLLNKDRNGEYEPLVLDLVANGGLYDQGGVFKQREELICRSPARERNSSKPNSNSGG